MCTLDPEEHMSLPTIANKNEVPCAAYYRHGIRCKRAKCNRSHVPIDRLSPESQKTWIAHVTANNDLYFNPRRVTVAAEGLKSVRGNKRGSPDGPANADAIVAAAARPAKK